MFKPNGILTFTSPSGKTHLEIEQDFAIEHKKRLMEFMISPVVQDLIKKIGDDLFMEYMKVKNANTDNS